MTTSTSLFKIKTFQAFVIAVAMTFVVGGLTLKAEAKRRKNVQMKSAIVINQNGDAEVDVNMELPEEAFKFVKSQFGDAKFMARQMNKTLAWSEISNIRGKFIDSEYKVNAGLTNVGYAKPYKAGKWVIDLSGEGLTFVAVSGTTAHFTAAMDMPFGATNIICRVHLPDKSTNIKYNADKGRLFYDFVPEFEEGDDGEIDFELDAKAKVMSSLAKIYGYEKFDNFWVARSKFRNAGNQVVKNLRVRHRIANLSSWSGWKKTRIVYPGQTVIEPFFPVFDIEKLAAFTSTRNAMVEVEYSYEIDGEKLTDTDSVKLQILARNEVEWSSYDLEDVKNFYEIFDNCPQIYATFTNENDPVVQQVAGTVSRMINGIAPQTDKAAMLYLKALWIFMEENRISYQLPPGSVVEGHMVQNLKYARDVIRNKAGTCADLSVFWASVVKAAGMEPVICGVPGHAFPAFIMPESKAIVPLESTLILKGDFETALAIGKETMEKFTKQQKIYMVNIGQFRSEGVHCLDLPKVDADHLKKLGYKMDIVLIKPQKQVQQRTQRQASSQKASRPANLVGTWRCEVQANGGKLVVAMALLANGECACVTRAYDMNGNVLEEDSDSGAWVGDSKAIYTKSKGDGQNYTYPYRFQNGYLIMTVDGNELAFKKVK